MMNAKATAMLAAFLLVCSAAQASADSLWATDANQMVWYDSQSGAGLWYLDTDGDTMIDSEDNCPTMMPVHLTRDNSYHSGLQSVYDWDMVDFDTVEVQGGFRAATLDLDKALEVKIDGGYNCDFVGKGLDPTFVESLTINTQSKAVEIEDVAVE